MARAKPTYVQIREPFSVGDTVYQRGKVYAADHPIARKFGDFFEPLRVEGESPAAVEDTTKPESPKVEDKIATPAPAAEDTTANPGTKRGEKS